MYAQHDVIWAAPITLAMIKFYLWIDFVGSVFGILSNIVLLTAIFRSSHQKLQAYSFMFLFPACYDIAYSILELSIQHLITVENQRLFVMPHGIEQLMPESKYIIFGIHSFLAVNAMLILPCQYKFRYDILRDPHTSTKNLINYVGIATIVGSLCGCNCAWMAYEQQQRPSSYYMKILQEKQVEGREFFMYGADMQDLSTKIFYCGLGLVTSNVAIGLCIFYAWKSYKFVQVPEQPISRHTRSLQRNFSIGLVVQTINSFIFAISPISCLMLSMVFGIKLVGLATMLSVSYLPVVNATFTIIIIRNYRLYVMSFFRTPSSEVAHMSTSTNRISIQ
ncbi:hypothetical protein M3Y98_00901700 [Aphelenchoides besseyi]|nr:hypothetical protein M3Y98_00901700 [Aphelenchoides besseyi]KAI6193614.1 hypothetical protein M3Y96_01037400 [Aphelenchoides besseyi]